MEQQFEIWKEVIGFEGYKVSNLGRVMVMDRVKYINNIPRKMKNRIMSVQTHHSGYCNITLVNNNLKKTFTIHRLVALTFIDNPNNLKTVNHINGDKKDNRITNLEWMSQLENNKHARLTGLKDNHYGENNPKSILNKDQVLEIREFYSKNKQTKKKDLAKKYNISLSCLVHIINKTSWKDI